MKYGLILLLLAGCAKETIGVPVATQNPQSADSSVLNKFEPTSSPVIFNGVDFSKLTLNATQAASLTLDCNGAYGNSGSVNGVAEGKVRIQGTAQKGTIQFGHLAYQNASNSQCKASSKESYTYEVSGDSLTLCLSNPSYPYCTSYKLVN